MKHFVKTLLTATLCALSIQTFAAPQTSNNSNVNVSPAEQAKIEKVIREYLIAKPEILMQAFQVLQQRQYQQAQQTFKQTQKTAANFEKALFHQANDPVAGNPNGKITVVEFFDYQCPHCVDMAPVIESAIKSNPDVRIVFKDFPIRGPMSEVAARAALAANKQGKYYVFSHALLTANKPLTEDVIFEVAKNNGVNVEQMKKDMASAEINQQLKANMKLAQDLKLFGTPAFFIGKTTGNKDINYSPGQLDTKQLQQIIDKTDQS